MRLKSLDEELVAKVHLKYPRLKQSIVGIIFPYRAPLGLAVLFRKPVTGTMEDHPILKKYSLSHTKDFIIPQLKDNVEGEKVEYVKKEVTLDQCQYEKYDVAHIVFMKHLTEELMNQFYDELSQYYIDTVNSMKTEKQLKDAFGLKNIPI